MFYRFSLEVKTLFFNGIRFHLYNLIFKFPESWRKTFLENFSKSKILFFSCWGVSGVEFACVTRDLESTFLRSLCFFNFRYICQRDEDGRAISINPTRLRATFCAIWHPNYLCFFNTKVTIGIFKQEINFKGTKF